MSKKTYGYERKAQVPSLDGTQPKLCSSCSAWFAAYGKQRRCDRCVPGTERRRRAQLQHYASLADNEAYRPSERRAKGFSQTHLALPGQSRFSTKPQVSGPVSDSGALCRELALELAGQIDHPKGTPQRMGRAVKRAYVARAVSLGLQGRCDLERYN